MFSFLPALFSKKITFKRITSRHVKGYKIYGLFKDSTAVSGIRKEELDFIDNPDKPDSEKNTVTLEYNDNATWELPKDMYSDRDHKFKLFINDCIVNPLYYQYNKYNRLLTIDTNLKPINLNDEIKLEYFMDVITRKYSAAENFEVEVVPVFNDTYTLGMHNVII